MGFFSSAKKGIAWLALFSAVCMMLTCAIAFAAPSSAYANDGQRLYRIYNPNSGEHFYTANPDERTELCGGKRHGWSYEGVGWVSPSDGDPVYRLYNPNVGDHHYTMSTDERDVLVGEGWTLEGVGWYSDPNQTVPLYRDYNPNQFAWNHNYTANESEHKNLVSLGWHDEKIGWYGISAPTHLVYDNSVFRATYIDTKLGRAPEAVAFSDLVSGMAGPMNPEDMVDLLVPDASVAPSTNIACELRMGAPKLGSQDYPIPNGVSNNCATFFIWTNSKSGYLSVDLDDEGMIYPNAKANCYSFN